MTQRSSPSLTSISQVARRIFSDEAQQNKFIDSIINPKERALALIWLEEKQEIFPSLELNMSQQLPDWIQFISPKEEPGKSLAHQQGLFYCMDPSSVIVMLPLLELDSNFKPKNVLDLCASPGGKSILTYRQFKPANIVCNETIGARIPALLSNLKRCKITGSQITQADPKILALENPECADLILVDAPCSGQSLIVKDAKGLGCFSKPVINANVGRQRRILMEAVKILKAGGYLMYSTCTFSDQENQGNIEWLRKKQPELEVIKIVNDYPFDSPGAGGFSALLKKRGELEVATGDFNLAQLKHWQVYIAD